jgi:hypothetical protein
MSSISIPSSLELISEEDSINGEVVEVEENNSEEKTPESRSQRISRALDENIICIVFSAVILPYKTCKRQELLKKRGQLQN